MGEVEKTRSETLSEEEVDIKEMMGQAQLFSGARRSKKEKSSSSLNLVSQFEQGTRSCGNSSCMTCEPSVYEPEEFEGKLLKLENNTDKKKR
eukprot:4175929-Karenia_brevis.AAC.1